MPEQDLESVRNEAAGYSGFGGQRLDQMLNAAAVGAESNSAGALASLGIDDIEQLVAISSIPNVRDELKSQLSLDEKVAMMSGKGFFDALEQHCLGGDEAGP